MVSEVTPGARWLYQVATAIAISGKSWTESSEVTVEAEILVGCESNKVTSTG